MIGQGYMFGHIKALLKPKYEKKITIGRKIYEVSWPGWNSFYVVSQLGRNSFKEVSRPRQNTFYVHFGKTHFRELSIDARIC